MCLTMTAILMAGLPAIAEQSPATPEIIDPGSVKAGWQAHVVTRVEGAGKALRIPARFQLISAAWVHTNAQMPEIVYMPEKKRLLMTMEYGPPTVQPIVITSDDFGATWSEKRWLSTDAQGNPNFACPVGLTYLGNGVLTISTESSAGTRRVSRDYGATWGETAPLPLSADGQELYHWDPMLVDRDARGRIVRLLETRYTLKTMPAGSPEVYLSQAHLVSTDGIDKEWSASRRVPEWSRVNEVALVRARNGDIVAACRTDIPAYFRGETLDNYSGLAVSISKDNGATWSKLSKLYDYGRHHASMVVLPNGDIVMTYVVRIGYTPAPDGYPRFGVEAVVSHDDGQTWDLDHKYVLAYWTGKVTGANAWWGLSQSTSTVRLPDGSLLTAFGTGFRNEPTQPLCIMDVGLVKWRVSTKPAAADRAIRDAPFDSDLRNRCDPAPR